MPIYAYRCSNCGHAQDVLRKISDPVLAVCPACGQATYVKQVTAAGFQLKGSGWYVTDFRGDKKAGKPGDAAPAEAPSEAGAEKAAEKSNGDSAPKAETKGDGTKPAAPAPAPAPAPAAASPAPTSTPPAGKTGS